MAKISTANVYKKTRENYETIVGQDGICNMKREMPKAYTEARSFLGLPVEERTL